MIEHAKYTEHGSIIATIDGIEMSVPDDMGNRHRQMIAEWEAEGNTIEPYAPPPPSVEDVANERERRLALGFEHDFGDERGVHLIGTTPADMRKWLDEVTPIAQAMLNAGMPNGEIGIHTNTGQITITAAEWQSILIAAGQWRQPLYQASFALQAMEQIPEDYTDDQYWP